MAGQPKDLRDASSSTWLQAKALNNYNMIVGELAGSDRPLIEVLLRVAEQIRTADPGELGVDPVHLVQSGAPIAASLDQHHHKSLRSVYHDLSHFRGNVGQLMETYGRTERDFTKGLERLQEMVMLSDDTVLRRALHPVMQQSKPSAKP